MSPSHNDQPGGYPMFAIKKLRAEFEAKVEAVEELASDVRGLLDDFESAVDMENSLHGDVNRLREEMIRVAIRLRRDFGDDAKVAPRWLRLLAVAEFEPDEPPKSWMPEAEDLERWDAQYGDDE